MITEKAPLTGIDRLAKTLSRLLTTALTTLFLSGTAAADTFTGTALSPQPAAASVRSGLAVTYYYAMFEDVAHIRMLVKGTPGSPILELNHDSDSGKVLTANRSMGVGAEIRGMIHFPLAGDYSLRINSNDGVTLTLADQLVYEDPYVHSDTLSDPIHFKAPQPGWYSLAIDYFQRKGTSALGLYWTPPGSDEEVPVPAQAYGHLAN